MDVRRTRPVQRLSGHTSRAESGSGRISPISLEAKQTGERSAGNPHAAFDAAEAGNVARSRWCDTRVAATASPATTPDARDGRDLARSPPRALFASPGPAYSADK